MPKVVASVHLPSLLVASSGMLSAPLRKMRTTLPIFQSGITLTSKGPGTHNPKGSHCGMTKTEDLKWESVLSALLHSTLDIFMAGIIVTCHSFTRTIQPGTGR